MTAFKRWFVHLHSFGIANLLNIRSLFQAFTMWPRAWIARQREGDVAVYTLFLFRIKKTR